MADGFLRSFRTLGCDFAVVRTFSKRVSLRFNCYTATLDFRGHGRANAVEFAIYGLVRLVSTVEL